MSYHKVQKIRIVPSEIRDFYQFYAKSANFKIDLWQEHVVVGLDILLHNRGAASITLSLDKGDAMTIEAGDTFTLSNIKYALLEVTAAVNYDLVVAGIYITKERIPP